MNKISEDAFSHPHFAFILIFVFRGFLLFCFRLFLLLSDFLFFDFLFKLYHGVKPIKMNGIIYNIAIF